eukprot:scaffold194838_cov30-Tisochrysis_lutea.AAC.2
MIACEIPDGDGYPPSSTAHTPIWRIGAIIASGPTAMVRRRDPVTTQILHDGQQPHGKFSAMCGGDDARLIVIDACCLFADEAPARICYEGRGEPAFGVDDKARCRVRERLQKRPLWIEGVACQGTATVAQGVIVQQRWYGGRSKRHDDAARAEWACGAPAGVRGIEHPCCKVGEEMRCFHGGGMYGITLDLRRQ